MEVLLLIILNVIVPVFLLIGAGIILHIRYPLDMNTLAKLNTYLLMPALCFVNIYQNDMKADTLFQVLSFLILQSLCLMALSAGITKIAKFDRSLSANFKNSVVLVNSGNFGLPVSQLVFQHNPLGLSIQIIVLIFQNLLTYTYGLYNSVSVNNRGIQAMKVFQKNPVIYAFLAGLLCHVLSVQIPGFIWTPIKNTSDAFLAIALITLGAQSASLKLIRFSLPLVLSIVGRLILSPVIAIFVIVVLGLEGTIAQALFIASSFPTSRNSSLFALEYGDRPEYAAQAVLISTVFSMATVTIVVYTAKLLFP
ncbi:Membrane transport protein [Planococcus massiliensis]|uniref:Membrane transport protein n=1 Tax=Planococcus massiliensis TaxID=1499687 RepID=A0A098EHM8_9BACL|nr:AEC family transporter [Planococcus massiliensis]CEG21290.1 Membrane transport protein [Planococcus massiliensis]